MPFSKKFSAAFLCLLLSLSHATSAMDAPRTDQWVISAGMFNVMDNDGDRAAQISAEYRAEAIWYGLKPTAGLQFDSDGALYAFAGGLYDIALTDHWHLAPSIVAGVHKEGDGRDLGHAIQFRSAIELAYQTDDLTRYGLSLNHMSNGRLGERNPGAESIMLVYGRGF